MALEVVVAVAVIVVVAVVIVTDQTENAVTVVAVTVIASLAMEKIKEDLEIAQKDQVDQIVEDQVALQTELQKVIKAHFLAKDAVAASLKC
jgi:hypothetical protein